MQYSHQQRNSTSFVAGDRIKGKVLMLRFSAVQWRGPLLGACAIAVPPGVVTRSLRAREWVNCDVTILVVYVYLVILPPITTRASTGPSLSVSVSRLPELDIESHRIVAHRRIV